MEQKPLQERQIPLQDGSTKTLKIVELVLTDGIDTFVAEAFDDLADSIDKKALGKNCLYGVSVKMQTRLSSDGRVFNSLKITSIIPLYVPEDQTF